MKPYNEEEVWKDIPGYEGLYQVSSFGRVKRINYRNTGKDKLMKPRLKRMIIQLVKNRKNKKYYVHQLVAMAFLGHVPCGWHLVIDHLDSDPTNNMVENLRIVTQRKNLSKERSARRDLPVGVYKTASNKFMSQLNYQGKVIYLGSFDTPDQASKAYEKKLIEIEHELHDIKNL